MAINYRQQYSQYSRYFVRLKDIYNQRVEVRESLELLLSLLLISFLVIFAIRPTVNTIAELFANLESQKQVQERLDNKLQALSQSRNVWAQAEQRLTILDQAISEKPKPHTFLQQVEGLVVKNNVTLDGFSQENVLLSGKPVVDTKEIVSKKPPVVSGLQPAYFSFSVSGDYENLLTFLSDFEKLRQQIVSESFSFLTAPGESKAIILKISGYVPYFDQTKK